MEGDSVDVWHITLDAPNHLDLRRGLDAATLARADRFVYAEHRTRAVQVHAAATAILRGYGAQGPWIRGPYGKPALADGPQFNLSHSGDVALLAVSERPVGVDVERVRAGIGDVTRYFGQGEQDAIAGCPDDERPGRLTTLWTRKEALAKAFGGRLADVLHRVVPESALHEGAVIDGHRVRDLPARQGCRAAVALAGTGPYQIRHQQWTWTQPEQGSIR